jgi:hypothetical protein
MRCQPLHMSRSEPLPRSSGCPVPVAAGRGLLPSREQRGRSARAFCRRLAVALGLLTSACAHDARLEVVDGEAQGQLIRMPDPASLPSEAFEANIELLGLSMGTLHSSRCTTSDSTTLQTRIQPAALVNMLHRSGGDARTELGALALAPSSSEFNVQDGDLLRHYEVEHRPGAYDYAYDNGGEARRTGQETVPEGAYPHDLQSALLLLRHWRPRLGEKGYFYVVLGRRLWRVEATAAGPEMLQTESGPQLTHRLDGTSVRLWQPTEVEPRRFSLWLSEDSSRAPLRMVADASFGEVSLRLLRRQPNPSDCARVTAPAEAPSTLVPSTAPGSIGQAWSRSER